MRFHPGWKLTVLCCLLLPLLIALGVWQLDRAQQKDVLLARIDAQRAMAAAPFAEISGQADPAYRRVILQGAYVNGRDVLLDNRTRGGRFGYELVQPFLDRSGVLLLVNRGWLAGSLDRREFPVFERAEGALRLLAEVHVPLGKPFTLGDGTLPAGWPKRVQNLDIEALSAAYEAPLYRYELRLQPGQQTALVANWSDVNLQPSKHRAYAVQWFAMAGALVAMYLAAGFGVVGAGRRRSGAGSSTGQH